MHEVFAYAAIEEADFGAGVGAVPGGYLDADAHAVEELDSGSVACSADDAGGCAGADFDLDVGFELGICFDVELVAGASEAVAGFAFENREVRKSRQTFC